ncbi:hypothetical protein ACFW6E_39295 [Streptomyces olivaceoviridis]|uniref:hypothetical protein n=1 Tax=Streptomyces olivaceoviridis TaxID=1921 RepID=UPI0036CD454C
MNSLHYLVDFSIATAAGITADFVKRLLDKRDEHSDSEPDEPVDREDAPTPARRGNQQGEDVPDNTTELRQHRTARPGPPQYR